MNVIKKELPKSQVELIVELSFEELKPFIERGAESISKEVKIEGFRPGKAPYDVLKRKIGEMSILEEAARIAINKTIDQAIKDNVRSEPVGHPEVNIIKLSPENPLEYKVVIAVLPKIKLGDYKSVKVKTGTVDIKDEDVEKVIEQLREARAQEVISDKAIQEGDKVTADIGMFLDNVPV
ncbi:MAG: trigger factor, partial [Patescibacteria group bacterium]